MAVILEFPAEISKFARTHQQFLRPTSRKRILLIDENCHTFAAGLAGAVEMDREFELCSELYTGMSKLQEDPNGYALCLVSEGILCSSEQGEAARRRFEFDAFHLGVPVQFFEGVRSRKSDLQAASVK